MSRCTWQQGAALLAAAFLWASCSSHHTNNQSKTSASSSSGDYAWPDMPATVEHYEINFDSAAATVVYDMTRGYEYVDGTFTAGGTVYKVKLRQRGQGARYHPKHSWKVKMTSPDEYQGVKNFNLMAEYNDSGYLNDVFAYNLMRAANVPASQAHYVTLSVNGEYQGIYTQVEDVNQRFLKNRGIDNKSTIYRCGERDCEFKITPRAHYQADWENKTYPGQPHADLDQFLDRLAHTPDGEIETFLTQNIDLDDYLRYMAVNALISNAGIDDSGSYFVHDVSREKWLFIPWDLNNCVMFLWRNEPVDTVPRYSRYLPIYTAYDVDGIRGYDWKQQKYGGAHLAWSVLNTRIWDRPALRNRALDYLEKLMDTVFSQEQAGQRIDAQYALLKPLYPTDPWVDQQHASQEPAFFKDYVVRRTDYLRANIPQERHRGEGSVVINALGAAGGTKVDEQGNASAFIELYNREPSPVDLTGKVITDDLRSEFKHRLPAGLVVPAQGTLLLWADNAPERGPAHLPFVVGAPGGELGLFDGQSMTGVIDLTYYGPLSPGQQYERTPTGSEDWSSP